MNLIRFAINRKVFIAMLFLGTALLGIISYQQLAVELLPSTELPFLIVRINSRQDMDPQYIEKQAVVPLEGVVSTLEGIDRLETYVERRSAMIMIYFNTNVRIKYAYLKLQEKVDAIKPTLGDDFMVMVLKIDTEQLANMFMTLQVRGGGGLDRIRQIVDSKVLRELENIDGIANVEVFGGKERSVEIVLDEDACRAFDLTPTQIRSVIARYNQNKTFVGHVYERSQRYFVNLVAEFTDVADLENIVVRSEGPVLLKHVAEINFGHKEKTTISRVNGKEAITMQLIRDAQVNLIRLSHETRSVIARLNERLSSEDIEIVIETDMAKHMETNIDLVKELVLIGAVLAVIILWIFLRNLRLVIVIALAIPTSILIAFNFFYAAGITINSLTLVGMALAVGMLVDNSVVVLENIYRYLAKNQSSEQAVVKGTYEVWRSIFAATLTTIMVFLPFIFSGNFFVKLLGKHIGVSIISTLLISLIVALLLIPTLVHTFSGNAAGHRRRHFSKISAGSRLLQIYQLVLKSSIRFPARTIIGAVVLFFISLLLLVAISLNVPQEAEVKEFKLYVTMPRGATLETTDVAVAEMEELLNGIEEKQDIISQVYEEEAIVTIKLADDFEKYNKLSLPEVKNKIQKNMDDFRAAEVSFEKPQSSSRYRGGGQRNMNAGFERMLGIGSQEEKIIIKGRDFEAMRAVAEDIQSYLDEFESIRRVSLSVADTRPEINLLFDNHLLSEYNITAPAIAAELSTFENEFSSNLKFKYGIDEYDIIIRNEDLSEKTIDDLRALRIPDQGGGIHELEELSRIIYTQGVSGINRVNQEKHIELYYQFEPQVAGEKKLLEAARQEVDDLIARMRFPSGMAVQVEHEDSQLDEFYFLIGIAILLIYMVLASVFESLLTPVVMMFTLPLAAIGSFWALIFTGNSLMNANVLIGFLILLGVVVNNGVIFIDYTNILRKRGFNRSRALMMAGQARIRPIFITTLTTVIGMLPLAMGKAEYVTRIGAPFAITVIGGLALGTLFTLVFIPTVYSGLEIVLNWLKSLSWRTKLVQIIAFAAGCYIIYANVYSVIWRFADLFVLFMLIPGMTYFIQKSLRSAKADYIKPSDTLVIKIQHLVKIYDYHSRFVREWKKGREISARKTGMKTFNLPDALIWQLPLLGFLTYFVYFYLKSFFWSFVVVHAIYFYIIYLWHVHKHRLSEGVIHKFLKRMLKVLPKTFIWAFPLLNLAIFYLKWQSIGVVIFIAVLWYLTLTIYTTSERLHKERVNLARLKGRFTGIRRNFYKFVQIIPVIGRKKIPFKALDGVSIEIGSGMFGLLGPNGAGKTTLMRIVCGILEQTRGTIRINGINLKEKREELQGLIGYLPQEFGTYENMTAYEFLGYQAILKNIYDVEEREKRIDYVLKAVHLEENRNRKIGSFSGGMKQRIGIAQTLLHLPRILVVDEPTAGLDPRERIRFRNLLVELSRERVVIFSTHIIEDISSSCNRVAVLDRGTLKYLGEPIKMAETARGHVWQFFIAVKDFEQARKTLQIVHHMRVGERIRVRCLAAEKPYPEAESVRPTLEDAYLWLLRRKVEA